MIRIGLFHVFLIMLGFSFTGCGYGNDPIISPDVFHLLQKRIQKDIDGIRKESAEIAKNSEKIQREWEKTQALVIEMVVYHPEETTRKAIAVYEELQKPRKSES